MMKDSGIESDIILNEMSNSDEIDLVDLFLSFWDRRKIIFYSTILFFLTGIAIAFTSREEYTAQVRLIPETGQQNFGMNLAQQFGIRNITTPTSEGLPVRLYPDIVSSSPFLLPLLEKRIYMLGDQDSLSLMDYFNDHYSDQTAVSRSFAFIRRYTLGLPSTVAGWFSASPGAAPAPSPSSASETIPEASEAAEVAPARVVEMSSNQRRAIGRLRSRITVNTGEGIITINTKMPEARMAADLADHITVALTGFIKDYRTEKARIDAEFVEERYNEARRRFERSQEQLARFRDHSRGQLTQVALTEEQRLQSEYDLAFNVYSTLARRLEEARLTLQEETPVVQVLEPAIVPVRPSEPNRDFIVIVYTLFGVILGFLLVFIINLRRRIIETVKVKKEQ